jgi:predicted phosphate transport protein (TIGR00153 family)
MFRLIPKEEKYFTMLDAMAAKVKEGGELFVRMFEDYQNRAKYVEQIKQVEVACDKIAADITQKLNSSFITPLDREDIFLLVRELDDVIDMINDVAANFDIYDINELKPDVHTIVRLIKDSTSEVHEAVGMLEKSSGMTEHLEAIYILEKQGDSLYHDAMRRLFREEQDPLCVVKWKAIYEELENSLDRCKDLAEALEGIVVKNK